uniref:Uncharacterized protein n=1 Tax=Anguilla anguilla TaxID=7936 RepID=A0A0E9UGB2_ANGAN
MLLLVRCSFQNHSISRTGFQQKKVSWTCFVTFFGSFFKII